jgi:hypothetical protein
VLHRQAGEVVVRRFAVLTAILCLCSQAVEAKEPIWTDGNFYLYDEDNSCALYASYDDGSMLRLSFKGSTDQVFYGYYSDSFSRMPLSETMTVAFATEDDPKNLLGYVATIVDNGGRKGIAGSADPRLLEHLQGAQNLQIFGPLMLPVADLSTQGLDDGVRRMRQCGRNK